MAKTRPRSATPPGTAGSARKRPAGRPAGTAEADLRERLLDAAIACYVRTGIAASSLRAIATEAGVTPALLHYYFGDKTQLQQAVVEERLMPALGALRGELAAAGDDIVALVTTFVRGVGALVERHPWLPPLWIREILCEGGALRDLMLQRVGPQLPQMLAVRFAQAQREGRLNPALDPRLLVVSLVGLTLFPAAGAPIWRELLDARELDMAAVRDHTIALLDAGIGTG